MDEKYIQRGPELLTPVNQDSFGIQLYNALANNDNKPDIFVDVITKERVSPKTLFEETCKLAEAMRKYGFKANDIISVCSPNSVKFFHPVISALYLGITVAPLNHTYTEDEIYHVLNLSKPKAVFCSKTVLKKFINLKRRCKFLELLIVLDGEEEPIEAISLQAFVEQNCDRYFDEYTFRPINVDSENHVAVVLCSSGTTGLPKGVMTTHANMSMRLNHARDPRIHRDGAITKLGFLPFFHGYGFMTTLASIIMGETVVVLSKFDEDSFLRSIQDYKITDLWLVPPLLIFLSKTTKLGNYDLSSVREITSGAAPLSKETEMKVKNRLNVKCIRQGYGLTEATLAVVIMPIDEEIPGCSGKVVPGMSIKVRDPDTGKTLGPHEVGELCIKGGLVMKGYINNPKATKESFTEDGWLLTGDMVYYDEKGYFFVVDRLKELIKYKGFQVAPAELEALLLTYPKVRDVGVVGLPNEEAGELPLAFVVKQAGVDVTEREIIDYVAKKVSYPKQLHGGVKFIDEIPKNPSGKILRRELRSMVKKFSKL